MTASASLSLPVSGTLNPSAPQLPVVQQLWDSIILVPVVPTYCGLITYPAAGDYATSCSTSVRIGLLESRSSNLNQTDHATRSALVRVID